MWVPNHPGRCSKPPRFKWKVEIMTPKEKDEMEFRLLCACIALWHVNCSLDAFEHLEIENDRY